MREDVGVGAERVAADGDGDVFRAGHDGDEAVGVVTDYLRRLVATAGAP